MKVCTSTKLEVKIKNGSQTQIHVLPNRNARMDKIRLLTRMGRQIPNGLTPNSSMDHAKRPHATVPLTPSDNRPHSSPHRYSNRSSTNPHCANPWSTNTLPNAIRPHTHKGTGKADAGATDEYPRSTAERHQEETGRA